MSPPKKILFIVNVDSFFISHRLPIAIAAIQNGFEVHLATGISSDSNRILLEEKGIKVHELSMKKVKGSGRGLSAGFAQIFTAIKNVRPDILHLVTITPVLLGGLAARLLKVPAVVYAISGLGYVFMSEGMKARLRRIIVINLYRIAFNHPKYKAIFQNNDDLNLLSQYCPKVKENSVLIKGSGVDLDEYRNSPLPAGPPVVTMVARLLEDKGVYEFVDAARKVKNTDRDVEFWLVGDPDIGNPTSISEEELETWKNEGVVDLLGYQSDIASIYSRSSIAVLPSYREGLPKSLIEAATCGRPIITTDVPGCRDVIIAGHTGILIPAKDSEKLAGAIVSFLNDKGKCEEMGRNGRIFAEKEFDIRDVVGNHLYLYRLLMNF